jgi:hypothetical protein
VSAVTTTRVSMFASRADEWGHARAMIEAFCVEAGVSAHACSGTVAIAEELFTYTVTQGHAGGSDAPIWIALEAQGARVTLTYEDLAPPFNPFAPGRTEMLEAFDYAYVFGRNRIRVVLG